MGDALALKSCEFPPLSGQRSILLPRRALAHRLILVYLDFIGLLSGILCAHAAEESSGASP
eukprot:1160223-Pelagomonas_calceolata.AAC.4